MRLADVEVGGEYGYLDHDGYRKPLVLIRVVVEGFDKNEYGTFIRVRKLDPSRRRERFVTEARNLLSDEQIRQRRQGVATYEARVAALTEQLTARGFKQDSIKGFRFRGGKTHPQLAVSFDVIEQLLAEAHRNNATAGALQTLIEKDSDEAN